MNKIKIVVSILFLFILISFSVESSANQEHKPFVEKAIKHGFKSIKCTGKLTLRIADNVECVEFIIEDNSVGIQQKPVGMSNHRSMAKVIFEKRRKLIQQKYNKDFNFEMVNLKDINLEKLEYV